MDWDHLRFVLAVAEAGGLSAAGRVLRVDPATVSRRLDAIEAELKAKLFHRSRRGLDPTEAGSKLVARARRIDEEVRSLRFELSAEDRGLGGTVTITATEALAAGFVVPALADFRAAHPEIAIEVVTDIRALDLGRREADIALRLSQPHQGDLRMRRLGSVGYALYAAPAYIEHRGRPETGWSGHGLIEWPSDYTVIPQVVWLREQAAEAEVVLRSTSSVTRLAAARAGLGIALLPCLLAATDPGVVRLPSEGAPSQPMWLVHHRDLAAVPRIRVTLDYLARAAKRWAAMLEGTQDL
jgi:DNA-binding transcriptional LysR family regulator